MLYIFILTLAILGVAHTNISHQPLVGYWELLGVLMGAVCVLTEWTTRGNQHDQLRLMWTQALHWIAVLITMNIMLLAGVQRALAWPATSLVLLMLLALGTFLGGLSLLSLPICFLGVALALTVLAIAIFLIGAWYHILATAVARACLDSEAGKPREQLKRRSCVKQGLEANQRT